MHIFITGATGYIGNHLAHRLANEGHIVHALCRNAATTELSHKNIHIFQGDITNPTAIGVAIAGCRQVYHLAAYARVWHKNPSAWKRLNVEGTQHVLEAACTAGVEKIVFTSTAGTLGPSGTYPVKEEDARIGPPLTDYEVSKTAAELLCREYAGRYGIPIVIVNPPRVYGPGIMSESNGVTRLIKLYLENKWRFIPGDGSGIGSYVYIDDVVRGHILAMEKGRSGERYSLSGVNVSYNDFFRVLRQVTGKKQRLYHLPLWLMMAAGAVMEARTALTGKAPLLTRPWIKKYQYHWALSSEKAARELGYSYIPLEQGLQQTVAWLQTIIQAG